MEQFIEKVASVNDAVNSAVWGLPGLILLIGTGALLTIGTKVFQVSHLGHWWKKTIASVFKKDSKSTQNDDKKAISQFQAFGQYFGAPGTWFVAIAMLFFAFTTVLGWSQYGPKAVEYLFGTKGVKVYKFIFVLMIVSGAVMEGGLAWDLSDTFNGLMMIPNLIGVIALFPLVLKITKNYVDRKINAKNVASILSYDAEIQKEMEEKLHEEE